MSRILIVEDDPIVRDGLVEIARSIDDEIEILVGSYAQQALGYIKEQSIDDFFLILICLIIRGCY